MTIWDLRNIKLLKTIDVGTPVSGISWDYTGQYLVSSGLGGIVVSQYSKSGKSWSEPLRKAVSAVAVEWASQAKSLVALSPEGALNILGA